MPQPKIKDFVKNRFGMDVYYFLKQKVESECLYDYEIAQVLNKSKSFISRLRKAHGIEKANGFSRRFERTYGKGSVERFKKILDNPDKSLSDVARDFGFTRENARHVYEKIYGRPYTEAYREKLFLRKEKRLNERRRQSKRFGKIMEISGKMKSIGIPCNITTKGSSYMITTNGYKLGVRKSTKPVMIGRKSYFRINNETWDNNDFDFFICLCKSRGRDTHFIIPANIMPRSIVSLIPDATPDQSKYAQFKEAWNLIMPQNPRHERLSH
ncbi:MAG: hypothetical protein ABII26_03160 [Pseudomonadota bacterium]